MDPLSGPAPPKMHALNLKQSDLGEIGTQPVEVSEVRSQNSIASSSGRCHDDRIDHGCSFDRGNGLSSKASQVWQERLDDAGLEQRGNSRRTLSSSPRLYDDRGRNRQLVPELFGKFQLGHRPSGGTLEADQRARIQSYASHSA